MEDWYSSRFGCSVHVTAHAQTRMRQRRVTEDVLKDLVEYGHIWHKDFRRIWIYKAFPMRNDNLICAAAAREDRLVIKTVMHHLFWSKGNADNLLCGRRHIGGACCG